MLSSFVVNLLVVFFIRINGKMITLTKQVDELIAYIAYLTIAHFPIFLLLSTLRNSEYDSSDIIKLTIFHFQKFSLHLHLVLTQFLDYTDSPLIQNLRIAYVPNIRLLDYFSYASYGTWLKYRSVKLKTTLINTREWIQILR